MRMTTALWALLVFSVLLSLGGFDVFATEIINSLGVLTPSEWGVRLVILGAVSTLVTLTTRLFTGQAPITTPAVVFVISLLALPIDVFTSSTMPLIIQTLVAGFWLFLLVSGVGAAVRSEF